MCDDEDDGPNRRGWKMQDQVTFEVAIYLLFCTAKIVITAR